MSKIAMRCAAPIMTAGGVQRYKPGDLLPVDHPDSVGWEWAESIVADDAPFAEAADEASGPTPDPVAPSVPVSEPVKDPEPAKPPVDF